LTEGSARGQAKERCREVRRVSTYMHVVHRLESKERSEALVAVFEIPSAPLTRR
jgi:hypothetical protein